MVKFTTINVDGKRVSREFKTAKEVINDWNSEDGTTLPSNDDEVVYAEVDGKEVKCNQFIDLINHLTTNVLQ